MTPACARPDAITGTGKPSSKQNKCSSLSPECDSHQKPSTEYRVTYISSIKEPDIISHLQLLRPHPPGRQLRVREVSRLTIPFKFTRPAFFCLRSSDQAGRRSPPYSEPLTAVPDRRRFPRVLLFDPRVSKGTVRTTGVLWQLDATKVSLSFPGLHHHPVRSDATCDHASCR